LDGAVERFAARRCAGAAERLPPDRSAWIVRDLPGFADARRVADAARFGAGSPSGSASSRLRALRAFGTG
jgi:hypothetical protein